MWLIVEKMIILSTSFNSYWRLSDKPHNEYSGTGYGLKSFHFESIVLAGPQRGGKR